MQLLEMLKCLGYWLRINKCFKASPQKSNIGGREELNPISIPPQSRAPVVAPLLPFRVPASTRVSIDCPFFYGYRLVHPMK